MEALGRGVLCMLIVVATRTVDTEAMYTTGSVSIIDGHAVLKRDRLDKSSTAYGTYNDTMYTTGWGVFNVKAGYSKSDMKDTDVMYAAGYLEGALTAERIYQHYVNIHSLFLGKGKEDLERKVRIFFNKQEDWVRQQISDNLSSEYWKAVSVIIAQLDGLVDGYTAYPYENKTLDRFAFQLLNGVGDMIDLRDALSPSTRPDWTKMSPSHFQMYFANHGHCSALFKVLGAYENIFMAHSSWFDYSSTIRIYKHYNFNLKSISVASKQMSFSSYPGFLESLDDYYLLGNGLVMIQTSINVYNDTLYDFVKPQSLLAWIRVRVANMMANNGKEWASMLSQYNSGTYNNQYMILNLNLITLNQTIRDDAFWVVEQMPSKVESGDQTAILRSGYWPSYNIPFYESIYNMSGYPAIVEKFGLDYSYQLAPRAKIFRRDQGKVSNFDDMKSIMRYNDYLHDPYSEMNSCNTICCRGDLNIKNPRAQGCYDTKVSDFFMAKQLTSEAISGPTIGTGLQPFKWTDRFPDSHIGVPQSYNFHFIHMRPEL